VQASPVEIANAAVPVEAGEAPTQEVEAFIRKGNKLMREGDILGARQAYRRAFASGDAEAALVLGRSYDPIYFARIAGGNAEPDPAKALEWYKRAMEAGAVQTAMVRIEDLKRFMSK
jgi:TPR repeat protein